MRSGLSGGDQRQLHCQIKPGIHPGNLADPDGRIESGFRCFGRVVDATWHRLPADGTSAAADATNPQGVAYGKAPATLDLSSHRTASHRLRSSWPFSLSARLSGTLDPKIRAQLFP